MYSHQFNNFFMYTLGVISGSHPLYRITMVGPYVTLYLPPSKYTFNNHKLCIWADMEPDHEDAHGTNILRMALDKSFTHYHVILPGEQSLDIELKNLLMSDKAKYGISELQIDQCVQQYRRHVENYSPAEHKLATRNLIRSVIRYHSTDLEEDETENHNKIDKSIVPVKIALMQSTVEQKYSKLENLRQILQNTLTSIKPENKNAFIKSLWAVSPHSPFKNFNRWMRRTSPMEDFSLLGAVSLIAPACSYMLVLGLLKKSISNYREAEDSSIAYQIESQNELKASEIYITIRIFINLLIGCYLLYLSPDITEGIYNHFCQILYGKQSYVDNDNLKKLVDDYLISGPEAINDHSQTEQNTEEELHCKYH